jgi:hypothetical protein
MKLTEKQLRAIISNQIEIAHRQGRLDEGFLDTIVDKFKGMLGRKPVAATAPGAVPTAKSPAATMSTAAPSMSQKVSSQSSAAKNRVVLVNKFIDNITNLVRQRAEIMKRSAGKDDVMKISRLARQLDAIRQQAMNIVQDLVGIKMASVDMARSELARRGSGMPLDASSAKRFIDNYVMPLTELSRSLSSIQRFVNYGSNIPPAELAKWDQEVRKIVDLLTQMEQRLNFFDLTTFLSTLPESISRKAAVISEALKKRNSSKVISEQRIKQIIREEIMTLLFEEEEEKIDVDDAIKGLIDKLKSINADKAKPDIKTGMTDFLKRTGEEGAKAIVDKIDEIHEAYKEGGGEMSIEEFKEMINEANKKAGA